jgi:hypothetical protein
MDEELRIAERGDACGESSNLGALRRRANIMRFKNSSVLDKLAEAAGDHCDKFTVIDSSSISFNMQNYGSGTTATYPSVALQHTVDDENREYISLSFFVHKEANKSGVKVIGYLLKKVKVTDDTFPSALVQKVNAIITAIN